MKNTVSGIDYRFEDPGLLQEALTHRSFGSSNNERLEFLGDSVLSLAITARLFNRFPDLDEGAMSRMRSRLVRGVTLAELAAGLELGRQVNLGEGEMKSGGFRRSSILADAFEALLGAIYLDGGYAECERVILGFFDPLIDALPHVDELKDPKTRLQEWLQARGRSLPIYELLREEGADHDKTFFVTCRLGDDSRVAQESGSSRRMAEQAAAGRLLELLQEDADQ